MEYLTTNEKSYPSLLPRHKIWELFRSNAHLVPAFLPASLASESVFILLLAAVARVPSISDGFQREHNLQTRSLLFCHPEIQMLY
jgi:hypothetical protein